MYEAALGLKEFTQTEMCLIKRAAIRHPCASMEDTIDTYVCSSPTCSHVYRNYILSSKEFHAGEYRDGQYDPETELLFKAETEEIARERLRKSLTQMAYLEDFMSKNYSLLEIAPGKGYQTPLLLERFKSVVGVDLDEKVVKHNKKVNPDVEVILSDFLDLPEDKTYDVLCAFDVIEHIREIDEIPTKMHSLANKYAIIQVPTKRKIAPPNFHLISTPKPHHAPFDGHLQYFSEQSLVNLFTRDNLFKCVFLMPTAPNEVANGCELLAVFEKVTQ
jgi:SAM-dependent methyltransferase